MATLNCPGSVSLYTNPTAVPQLTLAGVSLIPYMGLDVWGPVAGEVVAGYVYTVTNWALTANFSNGGGSVTCFPNTGQYPISYNWESAAYLITGWAESMDATGNQIASACYDTWFNDNTLTGPTGAVVNEVMLHFDYRNRGGGAVFATAVPFGGTVINGIAIPRTYWTLVAPAGSTAVYWEICNSAGSQINVPASAVDLKAMYTYLAANGFLAAGTPLTGLSAGYEICDTQGITRNYAYTDMWWYGG